ncbi:MAG TPA: TVP38/TMEM64 family protein [Methylomirabilota bacterium]|jgi:uncharacterized membrane protein YdjX (TVP38/TMEM64 family)|nr:TVP38/TMEM64 family protein [Methylomirabilota bacterium]
MGRLIRQYRWVVGGVLLAALVGYGVWLVHTEAPAYRFLVRLYVDKHFLKQTLREWGILAPILFMSMQALQVIVSPIPGEATGFLGGYLFGEALGLVYSTIGLTCGSVIAFWIGRWLGEHYVRNLVRKETWDKLGFIVEAEGAILCFIVYLIPGLPKDIMCYLFGISPMPLWVFVLVSGLGRIPGTWVLSAQGAHTATGNYLQLILISAVFAAVALPLYYYRQRIVTWLKGRNPNGRPRGYAEGLDRDKSDS